MNITVPLSAQGRFKLVKHTGHKFDSNGNVVEFGAVIEETPFEDNVFTPMGSAFYLNPGDHTVSLSVSGPQGGRSSSLLVDSYADRSGLPDENGLLWWRTTYRFSFPASSGGKVMTFNQASAQISSTVYVRVPFGSSFLPVYSGTVSEVNLPHPFKVDTANEAFDVVWEFTEYIPVETRGQFTITVTDGLGAVKSVSEHSYVIRPANFFSTGTNLKGWRVLGGDNFQKTALLPWSFKCGVGVAGDYASEPVFSETIDPESAGIGDPSVGQFTAYVSMTYGINTATPSGSISCLQVLLDHTEWQIEFDPPIVKQNRHKFQPNLTLTVVNRGA